MYKHLEPTIWEDGLIEDLISEELISKHIEIWKDLMKKIQGDEYYETPLDIELKNAAAYIDPLDGTKDFVSGYP